MGLFDLFKKGDKVGKDSAVDSASVVKSSAKTSKKDANRDVDTKLSFHPEWNVPQEQKYVFNFLANDLAPLKPNQLSLSAINIEPTMNGSWNVKAFFRSSLAEAIELGDIELLILDKDDNRVASHYFDFKELGVIPAESARPWIFTFPKSSINVEDVPEEGWKISFNLLSLRGHQLDLDDTWKKQLPKSEQEKLAEIVKTLPKLGKTEVNFTGLQAKLNEDGSMHASIFIRNGHDKAINLAQLPLEIVDARGEIVAKGSFKLNPVLTVQPNTTKPWTFIFPAELVTAEGIDLSRWTARVPQ
ncbi:accessory Sec system S-layer assembly protein [Lysinibacillus sp. 2017]|uniref:accessory Sec system S-layer assembly protein n=1 Tax=unclassified Lysinibacillus TaxID=2636778 RepID=UPI000D528F2C|nr:MULTISPECIES: accessory Sec system S-layer assembly protein [unclassified Lysinibacillus]AWE06370.1 accessory Sec system S-layer assembly protein [Lysinibacillus sp. 2017]TGN31572.1 accessory Sec system S-layer assembly protein [Lysinibacillus sp. S2017]